MMLKKIILAPQSYKGSIHAFEAAEAMRRGVLRANPELETVLVPVADGGDGTLEALVSTTGGEIYKSVVTGPLGQPVDANWGVMGDGNTAVIEMALASGLALIPHNLRDPRRATTRGTGELIKEALDKGFKNIVVGLGGSATNDAGSGMASALGIKFLDCNGQILPPGGQSLSNLDSIDMSKAHPRLSQANIVGATDVTNTLCGDQGASAIFGPQKGASPDMVRELDQALAKFAAVVASDLGKSVIDVPGSGAAGGLGAGLMAFANADLQSGIDMVCDVLQFDQHLRGASLILTGEGRSDESTIYDKAPVGVARRAAKFKVPTVIMAGSIGEGYQKLYDHGISGIVCIGDRPMSFERSIERTADLLEGATERTVRMLGAFVDLHLDD
tara:strand:- start:1147 stop:2307 length:1161 start_codon:yes stop_codon:yes gene_type:complete